MHFCDDWKLMTGLYKMLLSKEHRQLVAYENMIVVVTLALHKTKPHPELVESALSTLWLFQA